MLKSLVISNDSELERIVTEDGNIFGSNGAFENVKSVKISSIL